MFIEAHKTGSSLVRGVEPNDIDICILFHNTATMEKFIDSKGGMAMELMRYHDTRFLTCREGEYNYICTADPNCITELRRSAQRCLCCNWRVKRIELTWQ